MTIMSVKYTVIFISSLASVQFSLSIQNLAAVTHCNVERIRNMSWHSTKPLIKKCIC